MKQSEELRSGCRGQIAEVKGSPPGLEHRENMGMAFLICDSQDLTLQAALSEGVATVRQALGRGF
jgi:hypothetical protein